MGRRLRGVHPSCIVYGRERSAGSATRGVNHFTSYVEFGVWARTVSENRRYPSWVRYSGTGLELAGATAGLALVGYWIDGKYGTAPWALLAGVVIGIVGGLYNLVKESMAAMREAGRDDQNKPE